MRLDHRSRWPLTADKQLGQVHEKRRQGLGKREGEQRGTPARDQEHEADAGDGERSQDAVAEGVEGKREVRQPVSLGVPHEFRPPHVDPKWSVGNEETTKHDESDQDAGITRALTGIGEWCFPLPSPNHRSIVAGICTYFSVSPTGTLPPVDGASGLS